VTSNHIHLLVRDGKEGEVIPQTMQLIAGRRGRNITKEKIVMVLFGKIVIAGALGSDQDK